MLLAVAIGPGLVLHTFGDMTHENEAHGHIAATIADLNHVETHVDGEDCSFEHDHDQSHAANFSVAGFTGPVIVVEASLEAETIIYLPTDEERLIVAPSSDIDKPPRLTATA